MAHISNCKKQTFSDALFSYIFNQNQANFCLEFLTLNLCASIVVSFTVFGNDGFTSVSVRGILFCPRVLFIGHCISFCFKSLSFSFLYLNFLQKCLLSQSVLLSLIFCLYTFASGCSFHAITSPDWHRFCLSQYWYIPKK